MRKVSYISLRQLPPRLVRVLLVSYIYTYIYIHTHNFDVSFMRNLFPRVATHCGAVLVSVCVCGSPPFLAILQVFRHFFIACHKLMCWKSWVMMKTSSLQLGLASELISRTAISLVRKVMDCISRISGISRISRILMSKKAHQADICIVK